MFIPIKSTDGAMTPFEYIEAAAGTYQVGQLLNVTDGKLAAISADQATTPPYVCMQSGTVAAGELLAVTRVQGKYTFETELAAAAAAVKVGTKSRWRAAVSRQSTSRAHRMRRHPARSRS